MNFGNDEFNLHVLLVRLCVRTQALFFLHFEGAMTLNPVPENRISSRFLISVSLFKWCFVKWERYRKINEATRCQLQVSPNVDIS